MKVPWSSVFAVLKAIYTAFLKGKVVNLPGVGPVTLPSQGHTTTPAPLPLYLAGVDRRAPAPPRRLDGLPDPVEAPCPLSVSTLGLILFVVFGLPIFGLTMLGVVEWRTLADDTPGNHVTATLRAAFKRSPGGVFLGTLVWACFLTAIVWGVLAHAFFS
jgi:hypothetical protein